jgi:hypothetical protein
MPETKYDAAILQQYADDLYAQARWVIFSTAFIYGLVTFGVTFLISNVGTVFKSNFNLSLQPGVLLIALIGAAVGVSAGRKKAFKLKLEAQSRQEKIDSEVFGEVAFHRSWRVLGLSPQY